MKSKDEAIAWASRCPFAHIPHTDGGGQIELRQVYELEDFGPSEAVDPRLQEQMAKARVRQSKPAPRTPR